MIDAIRFALADLLRWIAKRIDPESIKSGGTD